MRRYADVYISEQYRAAREYIEEIILSCWRAKAARLQSKGLKREEARWRETPEETGFRIDADYAWRARSQRRNPDVNRLKL